MYDLNEQRVYFGVAEIK
ncbi:Protein of unknown function [Bacillus mycoides]|nr:Protein of unknown function [Bacillus mycoides]